MIKSIYEFLSKGEMRDTITLVYLIYRHYRCFTNGSMDCIWNLNHVFILYLKNALFKTYDKFTCAFMLLTDYILTKTNTKAKFYLKLFVLDKLNFNYFLKSAVCMPLIIS